MATDPYVYDKAKYHDETIQGLELPEEHAENHTVFFLRWLIENELMSDRFLAETDVLDRYQSGSASIHEVYEWWDRCLLSDMLSEEGNAFAMRYLDFEHGNYLSDYLRILQGKLPSEFHIEYTEKNYRKMRKVIDKRYREWKKSNWPSAS